MRYTLPLIIALVAVAVPTEAAETVLKTAIKGNTLSVNGQPTRLGAAQWAEPEKSWRTVGELIKSAVPPPNDAGKRPNVVLSVDLDGQAPWGALKALCMAASGLGIPKARVALPSKPAKTVSVPLPGADPKEGQVVDFPPGADPKEGQVVDFPLSAGPGGKVMTENGGRKLPCTLGVMKGLVKQLPRATVHVKAPTSLPAHRVAAILSNFHNEAKAGAVAFLPVKQITMEERADRKKAKDAVDRAFSGGALGGLGGK
jgi:hypothetical protein